MNVFSKRDIMHLRRLEERDRSLLLSSLSLSLSLSLSPSLSLSAAQAVQDVNSALDEDDPSLLLERLKNEHAGVENIQEPQALYYLNLLKATKAAKAEVECGVVFVT